MNLTTIRNALGVARNIAHDLAAIVGVTAGSAGAIVSTLDAVGIHATSANVAHLLLLAGLGTTVISKGVDSLNDALKGSSATATPPAVVPHG